MKSHYEIKLEKYSKILNIEVNTMLEMIYKDILPASYKYMDAVSKSVIDLKAVYPGAKALSQIEVLSALDEKAGELSNAAKKLEALHQKARSEEDCMKSARLYVDEVIPAMNKARAIYDEMEPVI